MKTQLRGIEKIIKKFQEGGAMPAEGAPVEQAPEGGAPVEGGGEDPLMQLAQAAMQALQSQDCQIAMQVCQAFVQMIQQAQGGAEQQSQPVFKKGGILLRREKI